MKTDMKPILFNADMVRAILSGNKTVTRRVVKPQPVWSACGMRWVWKNVGWWREGWNPIETITWKHTPYRPGDILYVRETFFKDVGRYMYKANYSNSEKFYRNCKEVPIKWRPSIHMPREAARIFLRVTDVRVERLQDISNDDLTRDFNICKDCISIFDEFQMGDICKSIWDSTIKPADRGLYGWDANPWVWVIYFERISEEEATKG